MTEAQDSGSSSSGQWEFERVELAEQVATEAAISEIELYCVEVYIEGERWFDTDQVCGDFDRGFMDRAIRFLELCGLLMHKPERPQLVVILERAG